MNWWIWKQSESYAKKLHLLDLNPTEPADYSFDHFSLLDSSIVCLQQNIDYSNQYWVLYLSLAFSLSLSEGKQKSITTFWLQLFSVQTTYQWMNYISDGYYLRHSGVTASVDTSPCSVQQGDNVLSVWLLWP